MWLVPKSEYLYMEAYRSGCNELHSKSCRSLSGVTSQTLDTSGFFRFSTLFQNWISTVFLRFVYDFYTWFSISRKPAKPWKYSMEMYRSGRNEADSKFLEAPAVLSAENVRRTRLCAGSDFTISYRSCVFFLHSSGARITLEIYGELSERSKVRHSKSWSLLGSSLTGIPWFYGVFRVFLT